MLAIRYSLLVMISNNKKGMYTASPFLGIVFFLIVATVSAVMINEDVQNIQTAKAGIGSDLLFSAQAIDADLSEVLIQNRLESSLAHMTSVSSNLRTEIESSIDLVISNDLGAVYNDTYADKNIYCVSYTNINHEVTALIKADPSGTLIGPEEHIELKPIISGYSINCSNPESDSEIALTFRGRYYYLNASNICSLVPVLCATIP